MLARILALFSRLGMRSDSEDVTEPVVGESPSKRPTRRRIVRREAGRPPASDPPSELTVPDVDAPLGELIRFASAVDPARAYQLLWGADFAERVRTLWARAQDSLRNGRRTGLSRDELRLCMGHLVTIAPYGVLQDDDVDASLRDLLGEYRDQRND